MDATNALFIMTSNVGHEARVGFHHEDSQERTEALLAEVHKAFRPELLNRLDDIVLFRTLTPEHTQRIARLMLCDRETRLAAQGIGLEVTETAIQWLCVRGYDDTYGARPLRRTITQQIENPIAGKILREEVQSGHIIVAGLQNDALMFATRGGSTR